MQTFLPFPDYSSSAQSLDGKRLGKQRVETYQVMLQLLSLAPANPEGTAFRARPARWRHPVMAMWAGREGALLAYQEATCAAWTARGYRDTTLEKTRRALEAGMPLEAEAYEAPPWLGDEALHLSHQSNLLRKDPTFYAPAFPEAPPDLPYQWPTGALPLRERCEASLAWQRAHGC